MRVALALLLLLSPFGPAASADDLDERLPVRPGGVLEVDLDYGEGLRPDPGYLEITSHGASEVRIVADAEGWGAWDVTFQLEQQGDSVRVRGRVGGAFSWLFGGPSMAVRIWVPRDFGLDLRSSAGPIRVEDVAGPIRARTRSADVEVSNTAGSLRIRIREGDARVSETEGDVDIRVGTGSIVAGWVGGDIEARTGGGSIRIEHARGRVTARSGGGAIALDEVTGPVEAKTERGGVSARFAGGPAGSLETRRGSVEVNLPGDRGAELDARSARGSVELADGLELAGEHSEEHALGRMNGGGAPLRLFTARGSIRLAPR